MNKPKIKVILGSIREGRAGQKVSDWFMRAVTNNPNADLELVDLINYPLPLFDEAGHPAARQGAHANPDVQKWLDTLKEAYGYSKTPLTTHIRNGGINLSALSVTVVHQAVRAQSCTYATSFLSCTCTAFVTW
jgi:hypothetical protein